MAHFSKKERYRQLASAHPEWPVFMQTWWLDALGEGWDACVFEDARTGRALAAMPFWVRKSSFFGSFLSQIGPPPLAPCTAVWVWMPSNIEKAQAVAERETAALRGLFQQIPRAAFVRMNVHRSLQNWLPAAWSGLRLEARFTHVLPAPIVVENVWAGLRSNVRGHIEKARKALKTAETDDFEAFFGLLQTTFLRLKKPLPAEKAVFERLFRVGKSREQLACRMAFDEKGRACAAVVLVWDGRAMDLLLTVSDEKGRAASAVPLLIFEAIEKAAALGLEFDFDGSMSPEIERVYRSFGGEKRAYLRLFRAKNRLLAAFSAFFGKG